MPFIPLVAKTALVKMVPRKETCIWCSLVHAKTDQRSKRFPRNSEISPLPCSHYCLSWVSSALSTVYPSHSLAKVWIKDWAIGPYSASLLTYVLTPLRMLRRVLLWSPCLVERIQPWPLIWRSHLYSFRHLTPSIQLLLTMQSVWKEFPRIWGPHNWS